MRRRIAAIARLSSALTSALGANRRLRASEAELRRSRNRVVAAADRERRRIEKDLHDGAQQHLLALALELQRAQRLIHRDPDATATLLQRLSANAAGMIRELADLINGVYPPVLRDRGLAEALIEAAAHLPIRCHLDIAALPRYTPEVEESIYWCCIEALQNIAKHAGADARSRLRLARTEEDLVFEVTDAGIGFDPVTVGEGGHGLTNMTDRIGAVGGDLTWWSAPGRGCGCMGPYRRPRAPRSTWKTLVNPSASMSKWHNFMPCWSVTDRIDRRLPTSRVYRSESAAGSAAAGPRSAPRISASWADSWSNCLR